VTLEVASAGASPVAFARGQVVRLGRARDNDVRVGDEPVRSRWTVSKHHATIGWDGSRWGTENVSDKAGLLRVYEPGFDDVPLEPGRAWVPQRHRWCLTFGHGDHPFAVVCRTDDHRGPAGRGVATRPASNALPTVEPADPGDQRGFAVSVDEDPTEAIAMVLVVFTPLEQEVLLAYYEDFARLPRPDVLEPRAHDAAAHLVGRSRDSTRKAIERANEKIRRAPGAPAIASGRNVSAEIGRWLAGAGLIDPPAR
jgi:hypothetical protein